MTSFHVHFQKNLSPPDLFDTKEQAHEFWLANREPGEFCYTLETVAPVQLSHLVTLEDLTSAIRMRAQYLLGDDSYVDSDAFTKGIERSMPELGDFLNHVSARLQFQPEGFVVDKRDFVMAE